MNEEISNFIIKYGYYTNKEKIKTEINKHLLYNTYVLIRDKEQEIIALARFNIKNYTAFVLDTIIRPDFRNKRVLKLLVYLSYCKFPFLKYLTFRRENKYPDRQEKIYMIEQFLRR